MNTAAGQHLERIRTDGFTIIENLLPADGVKIIRDELEPWLQGDKMGRNDYEGFRSERVYALLAKAPSVARIIEHPAVLALVVPPTMAGQYSERIQELLGYSIIDPGFMGFVDGRHPKHLIDAAYRGRKHRDHLPPS
jgi:hypothetical protein